VSEDTIALADDHTLERPRLARCDGRHANDDSGAIRQARAATY